MRAKAFLSQVLSVISTVLTGWMLPMVGLSASVPNPLVMAALTPAR